ncbi:substrate-binding domain-containing protein [Cohnella kolymensis]|uniref:substrate-binding domain-containing protein n=1 Tax=Cohnella kolymensis TaxID=1590652 RepID=UPI000698C024|nr:substrate-binding domain-containing protein [Cohnella kolymensis]
MRRPHHNLFKASLLVLLLALIVGCSSKNGNNAGSTNNGDAASPVAAAATKSGSSEKYKIGVAAQGLSHEFIKALIESMQSKADELAVELVVMDSQDKIETQLSQVDTLVAQKVDALILNSVDFVGSGPAVDKAKEAGIPVVEVITFTKNENYDVFVGTDPKQSGIMMGEFLAKALNGKGNVALLQGQIGHSAEITRGAGLKESLFDKYSDVKLVTEQTANWNRDEALRITEDWLQRFPELNAIAAQNDEMAMGALQAVEAAGRKDVIVAGIDGIPDALNAVKDGRLGSTILDNVTAEGKRAVEVAVGLIKGEKFDKKELVDYVPIDKSNVDQYLGK